MIVSLSRFAFRFVLQTVSTLEDFFVYVGLEYIRTQYFYVFPKSEHESANAPIIAHIEVQIPVRLVVGCQVSGSLRIFFLQQIARELSQPEVDMIGMFAGKEETVGKDFAVFLLVAPA